MFSQPLKIKGIIFDNNTKINSQLAVLEQSLFRLIYKKFILKVSFKKKLSLNSGKW